MTTVFNNKSGADHMADPKAGIMWAFISMIPFIWVCVLLTLCLGNVWVLKNGHHEVMHGSYLWKLVTRQPIERHLQHRGDMESENRSKPMNRGVNEQC
jgi:hypothetical protein